MTKPKPKIAFMPDCDLIMASCLLLDYNVPYKLQNAF